MQLEYQNAFALSQMETRLNRVKIPAGKFALVAQGEVCCPFTDALIGFDECLVSLHDTREEADAACLALNDENVGVLPHPTPAPATMPEWLANHKGGDEIPF